MIYVITIDEAALIDIDKHAEWYNKKQKNLGVKFADWIYKSIDDIGKRPFAHPSKYKKTREKFVKKFPYIIIFSIEDNKVIIERVFACKKNPKKKYRNLKK